MASKNQPIYSSLYGYGDTLFIKDHKKDVLWGFLVCGDLHPIFFMPLDIFKESCGISLRFKRLQAMQKPLEGISYSIFFFLFSGLEIMLFHYQFQSNRQGREPKSYFELLTDYCS